MRSRKVANPKRHSTNLPWFLFFIFPAAAIYSLFVVYPMLTGTFVISFQSWNPIKRVTKNVGLKNYISMFNDPDFVASLGVTLVYVLFVVVIANVVALLIAMAIEGSRFKKFFRSIFFIPYVVSGLIVGYLWQFIFIEVFPDLMNLIGLKGLASVGWYTNPKTALFAYLVIPTVWKELGFLILLYIAGLQSISKEVIEASIIDGCGAFQQKRHVVIPMLMSTISVNLFLTISDAFKMFEFSFISRGGPGTSSLLLSYDIYREAFMYQNYGIACAKAVVMMIIVAAITFTQLKITGRKEVEL